MDHVVMYMGKLIEECSHEELIECINYCAKENRELREDRDKWMKAGDAIKYLKLEN